MKTISVLNILRARIERGQSNACITCHAFSLAVVFFIQKFVGMGNHVQIRAMFNFILRSLYENSDDIIGRPSQDFLESIDNECIVRGKVYPPS